MLELARQGREYLVRTMGLSRRLALRVGSLMGRQVACTAALLEEARGRGLLEELLLSPELRNPRAEEVPGILLELLGRPAFREIRDSLPLEAVEQDGWQVIALREEVEAEEGFRRGVEAPARAVEPGPLLPAGSSATPLQAGKAPAAPPVRDEERIFSPERVAELRVTVFAGATSAERVSALRRLAFAPIPEEERVRIFIQALGEEDTPLRAAAARALQGLGLSGDVAEALRLLAEGTDSEREYASRRLGIAPRETGPLERSASVMALVGTLRSDASHTVRESAILTLARLAPALENFREVNLDLMRLLVKQAVRDFDGFGSAVRQAFRAFEEVQPGLVVPFLMEESRQTENLRIRAFLVSIAVRAQVSEALAEKLRMLAADCLMALPAEMGEAYALGAYLVEQGDMGIQALLDRLPGSDVAHQRFLVRLLDNAIRFRPVSDAVLVRIAEETLALLRSGSRQLEVNIFETWLLFPAAAPAELRRRIAEALLSSVRHYAVPQVHENVVNALAHLGPSVIPTLVGALREHPGGVEGMVTSCALGQIARGMGRDDPAQALLLREALRALQNATFSAAGAIPEVFSAMGQICATGAFEAEVTNVIRRNLLNRLRNTSADAPIIEALGWMAASPIEKVETLEEIENLLLARIEAEMPETRVTTRIEDGEEVFVVEGDLAMYADLIPACIGALQHLVLSAGAPGPMRERLIQRLLDRWKACVSFQIEWSPGNLAELTKILGAIGASPLLPQAVKVEIVHTLAGRMSELTVLESLSRILEAGDDIAEFDRLAAAVALRILRMLEEKGLSLEDREIYLRVLGRTASHGRFEVRGGKGERLLQRVLDEIAGGMRDGVPHALDILLDLRRNRRLPEFLHRMVAEEVERFTSLVKI
ncbi:MAG: hypothetical protein V1918_04180 [Planctomycetota bacterium]